MEKDRVLAEIREAIELNRTVKQKNNDALSHAEYLLKKEDEYNRGLNDAWELAKKITLTVGDGGIGETKLKELFDYSSIKRASYWIFKEFTPQEALAKLEAYEKSKNEIEPGDVVYNEELDVKAVIMDYEIGKGAWNVYSENGCAEIWNECNFTKTGKHIDISALLAEIGKE